MTQKHKPKILPLYKNGKKKRYYKENVDGFGFDSGNLAFGDAEDWKQSKVRRGKKQEPPLF